MAASIPIFLHSHLPSCLLLRFFLSSFRVSWLTVSVLFAQAERPRAYSRVTMQEHMDVTQREIAAGEGAWDLTTNRSRTATRQYTTTAAAAAVAGAAGHAASTDSSGVCLPPVAVASGPSINATCPYSGEPVADFLELGGKRWGFCNPGCRDKTVADPAGQPKFIAMVETAAAGDGGGDRSKL